jgi:hypothetical protein
MSKFNPKEHLSFKEGEEKVYTALKQADIDFRSRIFTSRDDESILLSNFLSVSEVPDGFKKWQLPIVLGPSQLFISVSKADVKVPYHSHDEGDGVRFIISGSVYYNGQELTAGDWMFIPAGKPYEIEIGPLGASMAYCYCCSCAGSSLLNKRDWVINPQLHAQPRHQ